MKHGGREPEGFVQNVKTAVVGATVGLLIFVGLPLVAWGVTDVGGFMSDPARRAYAVLAVLATVASAALVPPPSRSQGVEGKLVRRQRVAVLLLQVAGLAIVVLAPWSDRREVLVLASPVLRPVGLVLFVVGQVVMSWGQLALDAQFSLEVTVQRNHRLVTHGLYRYLRHPRYLGILLFTLGIALTYRSWLAVALVAVEGLVLLWRIRDEEALLQREFGAEWEAYARGSWRLLPFLY